MQRLSRLAGLQGVDRSPAAPRLPRAITFTAVIAPLCLAVLAACGSVSAPGTGPTTPSGTRPLTDATDSVPTPDVSGSTVPSAPATAAFVARARVVADAVRAQGIPPWPARPVLLSSWAPDLAFDTDAQKIAWGAGKVTFAAGLTLPGAGAATMTLPDGTTGPVDVIGAREALDRALRETGGDCSGLPPDECTLTVTTVAASSVAVQTSQGQATVPAWALSVSGLSRPISLVATAPGVLDVPTPAGPIPGLSAPGPGFNPADTLVSVSGSTITIRIGSGACDLDRKAHAVEFAEFVIVGGTHTPAPAGTMCTEQYLSTPAVVSLAKPLGDRVVIDVVSGAARFPGVPGF